MYPRSKELNKCKIITFAKCLFSSDVYFATVAIVAAYISFLAFSASVMFSPSRTTERLRAIFSECRESEDSYEKSIFLLFRQNIPMGELIQGKIV